MKDRISWRADKDIGQIRNYIAQTTPCGGARNSHFECCILA